MQNDPTIILADGKWINAGGGITTTTADQGTLRLLGSYSPTLNTITGNIGVGGALKKIDLAGTGATVNIAGNVLTNQLSLGNNTMHITGNYAQDANGTFSTTINSSSDYGRLVSTGAVTLPASTIVQVNVTGALPNAATSIDLINGVDLSGVSLPSTLAVTGTTRTATLRLSSSDLYLDFVAGFIPYAPRVTSGNTVGAAGSLDGLGLSATGDMGNVITTLNGLSSDGVNSAVNTMLPVIGFNPQVPMQLTDSFVGTQMAHLGDVMQLAKADHGIETGMSAGDQPNPWTVWIQAFGNSAHQSARGASNGYNLSNGGGVIGVEKELSDRFRTGIAVGNAESWVRSKDNAARTDINATQVSWYGGYRAPENPFYLNYSASYSDNEYNGSREIHVGSLDNRVANADYHADLYGGMLEAGYGIKMKKAVITPSFAVGYDRLHVAKYTETDAGDLNLNVAAQDYERVRLTPGIKAETSKDMSFGTVTPEVHAKYLWDVISDRQEMLSSFSGGGTAFATEGYKPAKQGVDLGTSITLATKKNVTVSLQYDFETREDYYSHTGLLNVAYKF